MPTKKSIHGRDFDIDGRYLIWHPEQFEGDDEIPDVRIPLRIKLGKLLEVGEATALSTNETMQQLLAMIAPHEVPSMREMDVNDFQDMVRSWMREYNMLTGASLGESSASASSSASTEAPSSTTSGNGSSNP
ncbi:MAG: hypothetical protein LCH43_11265 [Actinobacteria bacterium]|nr:hypothetical protein [Actinomycetota bacterium]